MLMVVLLYYDFRQTVMWLSFGFMVSNAIFTWITLPYPDLFGWGYLASCALTVVAALVLLWNRTENLEYLTFVQEQCGMPVTMVGVGPGRRQVLDFNA